MRDQPDNRAMWRLLAAFLLAPGLTALIVAPLLIGWADLRGYGFRGVWGVTFGMSVSYAYPVAIALGIPAYLVLHRRVKPTALNCAASGMIIAILPLFIVFFDQRLTWDFAALNTIAGVCGAIAGLIFWVVARAWSHKLPIAI